MSIKERITIALQSGEAIRKLTGPHQQLYAEILTITAFLPISCKIKERIYVILHDITNIQLCKSCNINPVKFLGPKHGYRDFCCNICSGVSSSTIEKRIHTNLLKYGDSVPSKTESIKHKTKETLNKLYSTTTTQNVPEVREKTKQTNILKYGTEYFTKSQKFKIQNQLSIKNKYGSHVNHINQRHFSTETISKLQDIDWLYDQNTNQNKLLIEIADELSVSISTICRVFKDNNIPIQYNTKPSRMELDIRNLLDEHNILYLHNVRNIIDKEIDIWIPSIKLGIECCGLYWHSDIHDRIDHNYHLYKLNQIRNIGGRLITLFEDEWNEKRKIVHSKILHACGVNNTKVYARNCGIKTVTLDEKNYFFDNTHIQGTGDGSISYGLIHNNELVACMTFIQRKNGIYELNRYSTKITIVGGFSKLLSYFKKHYSYTKIISYADLRWSVGDVYLKNGFTLTSTSKPDYFYVKNGRRFHRRNFTKSLLSKTFVNYDPNINEYNNCLNNNYIRIWGCGQLRFELVNI